MTHANAMMQHDAAGPSPIGQAARTFFQHPRKNTWKRLTNPNQKTKGVWNLERNHINLNSSLYGLFFGPIHGPFSTAPRRFGWRSKRSSLQGFDLGAPAHAPAEPTLGRLRGGSPIGRSSFFTKGEPKGRGSVPLIFVW